jgi:hypothetical protein
MSFVPIKRMWDRYEISLLDSDTAGFYDLMYLGEVALKTTVLCLVAALDDDKDRRRYRLLHRLVRADGVGEWDQTLQDALTGGAAHLLVKAAQSDQRELTMRVDPTCWQFQTVELLNKCLRTLDPKRAKLPNNVEGRRWFGLFAELRNATRGHGAPAPSVCGKLTPPLKGSLELLTQNLSLFRRSWAYIHRSLAGKYRTTPLSALQDPLTSFDFTGASLADGIYCFFDKPILIPLIQSTPEAFDFFYPNGAFKETSYECLSYITGVKCAGDASPFMDPPTGLPPSKTQGLGILDVQGRAFSNAPPLPSEYVKRQELESELKEVLAFTERHQVVTLFGPGGIGKTSLALTVIGELAHTDKYSAIVWFSARDIDLLPDRPLPVRPGVLTQGDIAKEFARLTQPTGYDQKVFGTREWFEKCLREPLLGSTLFVFDNFETMQHPLDVFRWLDVNVRQPNKILITTRHHEFKGDYPIEVVRMTMEESDELIDRTARALGIASWVTRQYRNDLYRESGGHPYVIKILLGEAKKGGERGKIERIFADKDQLLGALFERTYARLSPAARRTFLTLSNWGTSTPELAVEAVLLQAKHERFDVVAAISELVLSSFITRNETSDHGLALLEIPLVTVIFGRKKLSVEPFKSDVDEDTELLRILSSASAGSAQGLVQRIFQNAARQVASESVKFDDIRPVLEFISGHVPYGWLLLSQLYEEQLGEVGLPSAKEAVKRYLEAVPRGIEQVKGWERLASLCDKTDDFEGFADAEASLAEVPGVSVNVMSNAAQSVIAMLRELRYRSQPFERRRKVKQTIPRISTMIASQTDSCGASEFSQLAWLALNADDKVAAQKWTERGLQSDPGNVHCLSLARRLDLKPRQFSPQMQK